MTPSTSRASRRRAGLGAVVFIALAIGVIVVGGLAYVQHQQRRSFPEVTATPAYRSASYEFVSIDATNTRVEGTVQMDLVTSEILVEYSDGTPWRGDDSHWYQHDGEGWLQIPNGPEDDEELDGHRRVLAGMTIDQLVPPETRRHTQVRSVRSTTLDTGVDVRHFTMVVNERAVQRDPVARRAMAEWWGELDELDPRTPTSNLEVWVSDDGLVHQFRSDSDIDDQYVMVVVTETSEAPFDAQLPTDFDPGEFVPDVADIGD